MENTKNKNLIGISGKMGSGKDTVGKIIQYLTNPFDRDMNTQFNTLEDYSSGSKFEIKKFADKLKDIVCILIGCTREQLEIREFKEKELGEEWWYYQDIKGKNTITDYNSQFVKDRKDWNWDNAKVIKPTPRLLLQLIGTECMRDIIHPNTWVNALFSDYTLRFNGETFYAGGIGRVVQEHEYPKWIITDMRFSNELKAVKDRKGITIRVNRNFVKDCNYCGKTIREQMKGCNEITCYRQNLKIIEHPSETALDDAKFDYTIDNNSSIEDLIEKVREILIKEKVI